VNCARLNAQHVQYRIATVLLVIYQRTIATFILTNVSKIAHNCIILKQIPQYAYDVLLWELDVIIALLKQLA
jgi:hypothetical protein